MTGQFFVAQSRAAYSILLTFIGGKALTIGMTIRDRGGFELWRRLVAEHEPVMGNRAMGQLMQIMNPEMGTELDYEVVLMQ